MARIIGRNKEFKELHTLYKSMSQPHLTNKEGAWHCRGKHGTIVMDSKGRQQ